MLESVGGCSSNIFHIIALLELAPLQFGQSKQRPVNVRFQAFRHEQSTSFERPNRILSTFIGLRRERVEGMLLVLVDEALTEIELDAMIEVCVCAFDGLRMVMQ